MTVNCYLVSILWLLCALGYSASCLAKTPKAIQVQDYLGRDVVLPKPARRIVALAPHAVENLYSAGAGEYLVGAVSHCDYPEGAEKIPRVGNLSAYSVEAIVALKPDLVVVWASGRGGKIIHQLEALGLTLYASDPRRLEDVAKSLRDYSVLAGTETQGYKAAAKFDANLAQLKLKYGNTKPVSVLYQVWHEPLQTLNDQHIISDVIRACGGSNSFGDAAVLAPKISLESVLQRNPMAIVASGMGAERPDWLGYWLQWPSLRAVKTGSLYFVPPDLIQRHTVRILQGAKLLCEHLEGTRRSSAL